MECQLEDVVIAAAGMLCASRIVKTRGKNVVVHIRVFASLAKSTTDTVAKIYRAS